MRLPVLVLALCALALAGCGRVGGADSSAFFDAASVTANSGTARISMTGTVAAAGQTIDMSGTGVIDLKTSRAQLQFRAGPISMEEVMDGSVFYLRSPQLAAELHSDKPWIRLDLRAAGIDPAAVSGLRQDPSRLLEYLRAAGQVTEVGSEQVRGVQTTHYRAIVDVRKEAAALPAAQRAAAQATLDRALSLGAPSEFPIDVWIDAGRHLRRAQFAITVQGATTSMTEDMYDFGTPVRIDAPSPAEADDLSSQATGMIGG